MNVARDARSIRTPDAIRPLRPDDTISCDDIIRSLPNFFGVADGIRDAARAVRCEEGLVAVDADEVIGFVTYVLHNQRSAEITWMAVHADHRSSGVGTELMHALVSRLRREEVEMLAVKTSARPIDPCAVDHYAPTRSFYEAMTFVPLMELELYASDVALLMVRQLRDNDTLGGGST